jgi:hypothetical protein
MAKVKSFSDWLHVRDQELSEAIHNEVSPAMMRAALIAGLAGAAGEGMTAGLEKLHGQLPPMAQPEEGEEMPHGGGREGHKEEEGDPELGVLLHYISERHLKKLERLAGKMGFDFRSPNFKRWLMDMWGRFVGQPVGSFKQFLRGIGSVANNVRQNWLGWMDGVAHEMGQAWKEKPEENPPEDVGDFYGKEQGGYRDALRSTKLSLHKPKRSQGRVHPSRDFRTGSFAGQGIYTRGKGHRG